MYKPIRKLPFTKNLCHRSYVTERKFPKLCLDFLGTGSHFPPQKFPNVRLCDLYEPRRPDGSLIEPEWIERKLGIKNRYLAMDERGNMTEDALEMGVKSSLKAIEAAKVDVRDIGCVIFISPTPRRSSAFQQDMREMSQMLKLPKDCDLRHYHLGCSALATGYKSAHGEILRTDGMRYVLLTDSTGVGATMNSLENAKLKNMDRVSKGDPWAWLTPFLFADGSASAVLGGSHSKGIVDLIGGHDPALHIMSKKYGGVREQILHEDQIAEDGYITNTKTVADHFVPVMLKVNQELKQRSHILFGKEEMIDYYLIHQPNLTLCNKLIEELKKDKSAQNAKIPLHVEETANISGGTTLHELDVLFRSGVLKEGDLIRMLWIGAGNGGQYGGATLLI